MRSAETMAIRRPRTPKPAKRVRIMINPETSKLTLDIVRVCESGRIPRFDRYSTRTSQEHRADTTAAIIRTPESDKSEYNSSRIMTNATCRTAAIRVVLMSETRNLLGMSGTSIPR